MSSAVKSAAGKQKEPVWPTFKPTSPDPVLGKKELSPEQTLIEFISTSAALHGVQKQPLRSLEWDLLKVFPHNIMPANAAAWYMAKRKFYADQPPDNQLLPFLLKKYPDKFNVTKFQVEFLETYSKETARRKLTYLVQFGLDAYFSHKVDEYGVYFFDPNYYERTEPFHESLQHCTQGARSRLVASYFQQNKAIYSFKNHTNNLASVSKQPGRKVMTNTTGVIVSMVNNQYGFLKFGAGEKALFCAKALFRDGWQYQGDPLRLPAMQFDAYQVTGKVQAVQTTVNWFATLVWCGRKPAPKYYSTCADFNATPVGFLKPAAEKIEGRKLRQPSSSMMIGQVVSIRKNGAVISVRDDSQDQVFIPGWSKENKSRTGQRLTTLTGDTIGYRDLVAYYIDNSDTMPGFTAVGKNVMVLKEYEEVESGKQRRNRRSVSMSTGGDYEVRSTYSSAVTSGSESDSESEPGEVSDSELEWLENDIQELMQKEGPESKTHNLFVVLQKSLSEVRAVTSKGKSSRRDGRDSGLGSNSTTPKGKNTPMKVVKPEGDDKAFWRTRVAFSSLNDYRSSEDEDYESGDEVQVLEKSRRPRRQSNVSVASTTVSKASRRNRRSSASVSEARREERETQPYWVRAISLPEEYDETTGLFVPVDKFYNEEKDEDYEFPFIMTMEPNKDGVLVPNYENAESEDEYEFEEEEQELVCEEGETTTEKESEKVLLEKKEEDLEEELKELRKEATEELDEALLEGKHRESVGPVAKSPEKIIVTKPDSEETAEVIDLPPPPPAAPVGATRKIWYQRDYVRFVESLRVVDAMEMLADVESDEDESYVPPPVILEDELDYDEYDPEEDIGAEELSGLAEGLKEPLHKTANMVPIWVHVDSVKARKERAVAAAAEAERIRVEKEAELAAAQKAAAEKKEAAQKAAAEAAQKEKAAEVKEEAEKEAQSDGGSRKLSLAELEEAVQEIADGTNAAGSSKVTRAKVLETKEGLTTDKKSSSPQKSAVDLVAKD